MFSRLIAVIGVHPPLYSGSLQRFSCQSTMESIAISFSNWHLNSIGLSRPERNNQNFKNSLHPSSTRQSSPICERGCPNNNADGVGLTTTLNRDSLRTIKICCRFRPKFNWEERLFENHYIGIHRMVFLVRKFPALAGLIISIWILFGVVSIK